MLSTTHWNRNNYFKIKYKRLIINTSIKPNIEHDVILLYLDDHIFTTLNNTLKKIIKINDMCGIVIVIVIVIVYYAEHDEYSFTYHLHNNIELCKKLKFQTIYISHYKNHYKASL